MELLQGPVLHQPRLFPWKFYLAAGAILVAAATLACGAAPRPPTVPDPIIVEPDPPPPPPPPPVPVLSVTRVLAFGDSLTEGESLGTLRGTHDPAGPGVVTSYPFKLQGLLSGRYTSQKLSVYNGGFGGKQAREDGGRLRELLAAFSPQIVILMEGVNDLNDPGTPRSTVVDAMRLMIRDARAAGATVVLSTLPPQRPGGRKAFSIDRIPPYNADMALIAGLEGAQLVDIFPHISVAETDPDITPDGLHLTEKANLKIAQLYFDRIKALFEQR